MARKRKRARGISFGTIFTLALCFVTLLVGGYIFLSISGDPSEISIDAKLLSEPLSVLARSVSDTEPAATQQNAQSAPTQTNGGLRFSATPEPTQQASYKVSVTAVGQITLGTELRTSGKYSTINGYSYNAAFEPLTRVLSNADLSIATLRTGLSYAEADYDTYCAPAELAYGLQNAGINLFNLATDRLLDHGTSGVASTLAALKNIGAGSTGAYAAQQDRDTLIIQNINGVNVGVVSYTAEISAAGKKAASDADIAMSTRLLATASAAADIAALRANGADIVIVLAHWGSRSDTSPSRETKATADALINAGADIILGTNPTSVQELERRTVTAANGGTRDVFIAYSLGNFLIDDSRDTANITGLVLHLTLQWDAQAKRATISDAWYMPTWIMRWKDGADVSRYRVVPAGTDTLPSDMTDTIYANMKKAYQSLVTKLGTSAAQPKAQ